MNPEIPSFFIRTLTAYAKGLRASPVYIRHIDLVIAVPADALTPTGGRPSEVTVMIMELELFSAKCLWVIWFLKKNMVSKKQEKKTVCLIYILYIDNTLPH